MMGQDKKVQTLFDEQQIAGRVRELADEIKAGMPRDFVVVGLMVGSFVFVADLVRELSRLGCRPAVEMIRMSSYGLGRESSRDVHLMSEFGMDLTGRDVLIIDDIVDTGHTLTFATDFIARSGAASVKSCALLDKPARREVDFIPDFVGFEIPDRFVVGYGIDFGLNYRHLPFIGTIG
ncbi:MAG: hypoxanthine phosphoribosyltransferase [Hyphomicrobiales bacterium]|nr:MAG: hypoxanthine phosphoribosyltransferase [Hyphomicrobiales bacterium]